MIRHFVEGQGPTILLVHGFALDARMWRPQVAALRESHRVVTVDLPDFGASPVSVGKQSAAGAVVEVIEAVDGAPVHLVALSLGGAVAVDLALHAPRLVRSLSLLDGLLLGRPSGIQAWPAAAALAKGGKLDAAREAWLADDLFAGARARPEVFAELCAMGADYDGAHWRGEASTRFEDNDPAPRLGTIAVPTLVLLGQDDLPTFRAMGDAYASAIPGARLVTLPGVGHLSSMEAPEAVSDHLARFFASA